MDDNNLNLLREIDKICNICTSNESTSYQEITSSIEDQSVENESEPVNIQFISSNINSITNLQFEIIDDEALRSLLKEWHCEHIYSICLSNRIGISALKYMTPKFMEKFFNMNNIDLGTQIVFSHHLNLWQVATNTTVTSEISSLNSADLPCDNKENIQETTDISLDPYEILNKSSQGCRKVILELIINYIIQNNIKWSVRLAENISKKIKQIFPSEEETFYYMKESGRSPMGTLYSKYYNSIRKLKNSGLLKKRAYNKPSCSNNNLLSTPEPETGIEDLLDIISKDNCTWAELEQNWLATTNYRVTHIKNTESTAEILQKWKQYKKTMGFKLIDIDFKTMHPSATSLINSFQQSADKMMKFIKEKLKDPDCRNMLQEFEKLEHVTENSISCCILYLLHAVLVPTSRKTVSYNIKNNKRVLVKFSIKDSQNSFFLIGNTSTELEEKLQRKVNNKESIQPLILITGTVTKPKDIMVYFDGIRYKFSSIVQAVDICFKIFMLFNLRYPDESILVWTFIQKFYYNITTKYDKNHPAINVLLLTLQKD